jgi:hypothetical protein
MTEEKRIACPLCKFGEKYRRWEHLSNHLLIHHKKVYITIALAKILFNEELEI